MKFPETISSEDLDIFTRELLLVDGSADVSFDFSKLENGVVVKTMCIRTQNKRGLYSWEGGVWKLTSLEEGIQWKAGEVTGSAIINVSAITKLELYDSTKER